MSCSNKHTSGKCETAFIINCPKGSFRHLQEAAGLLGGGVGGDTAPRLDACEILIRVKGAQRSNRAIVSHLREPEQLHRMDKNKMASILL